MSPARELFFGGARGGGKSDWLIADFAKHARDYGPNAKGILLRQSVPQFHELQRKAETMYRGLAEWKASERTWIFKNGATLRMTHLDSMADVNNYMGHQYTWIGFDELTDWPSIELYEFMGTTLRTPVADMNVYIRATGNPARPGHAWVKDYFVDRVAPTKFYHDPTTGFTRQFIPSRLYDNPHLLHNDDYINQLKSLNPILRRAFLDGDWNVFLGQAFPEWKEEEHTCEPIAIDPAWPRWAACDWGTNKPYCILYFAAAPDGHVYIYRESYGQKLNSRMNTGTHEAAPAVARREWEFAAGTGCNVLICDPSMDAHHGHDQSLAQHFRDVGWHVKRGNNDRISGKAAVHAWLQGRARDGLPILQVFNTCANLIRTLPSLPYATKGLRANEDVDTTAEDHAYDTLRYSATSEHAKTAMAMVSYMTRGRRHEAERWNPNDAQWWDPEIYLN